MAEKKKCDCCQIELDLSFFGLNKSKKDGLSTTCKPCRSIKSNQRYSKDKEKIKAKRMQYYYENKEKVNLKQREYSKRPDVREKDNARKRSDSYKKYYNLYIKKRLETNPKYKLAKALRSRINSVFRYKDTMKPGSSIESLGCTLEELTVYLESKFQEGMTWDNYGKWRIDHIRPLSSFDLENVEEFNQANHYTNLQPLWAADNIRKKDKW